MWDAISLYYIPILYLQYKAQMFKECPFSHILANV